MLLDFKDSERYSFPVELFSPRSRSNQWHFIVNHPRFIHARSVLRGVRGIAITEFQSDDVVRHPLVQAIVDAYERSDAAKRS